MLDALASLPAPGAKDVGLLLSVLLKLIAPSSTRPKMARLDSSPKMMNRKASAWLVVRDQLLTS